MKGCNQVGLYKLDMNPLPSFSPIGWIYGFDGTPYMEFAKEAKSGAVLAINWDKDNAKGQVTIVPCYFSDLR